MLLEDDENEVVATVPDTHSARQAIAAERPNLVILDVRMPPDHDDDGARLAAELRHDHLQLPIVLLSQHVEVRHIVSLATAGYFGYLLKDRVLDVDDFLDALDRVARGGSALDPEVSPSWSPPIGIMAYWPFSPSASRWCSRSWQRG